LAKVWLPVWREKEGEEEEEKKEEQEEEGQEEEEQQDQEELGGSEKVKDGVEIEDGLEYVEAISGDNKIRRRKGRKNKTGIYWTDGIFPLQMC
jgi:hypothetical protein